MRSIGHRPGVEVVLRRGRAEVGAWALPGPGCPDLGHLDALARWQLAAHRVGCTIALRGPEADLRPLLDLLELAGLADVVPLLPDPAPRR